MIRCTLLGLGFSCCFVLSVGVAADPDATTHDSGAGVAEAAVEEATAGDAGASSAQKQTRASAVKGSERRPASTATAAGIIHEQVKQGKMNIQVDTDAGPLP